MLYFKVFNSLHVKIRSNGFNEMTTLNIKTNSFLLFVYINEHGKRN